MKELSIEEKAKRYDKAIERAEGLIDFCSDSELKTLKFVFPELKESDGEKIRNVLIGWINLEPSTSFNDTFDGFSKEQILAWLEKQGEQSIKWNKNTEGNKPQKNHSVLIKTTNGIAEGEWNGGKHWIQYRWSSSIKDSDVLFWIELYDIEEQGKQKPVNTIEQKVEDEEYDGEDYGIDSLWHAKNILEKTLGEVEGYQTDDGILDHKCAISSVDKLYKQSQSKQEWSEEDESNFQMIIDVIKENKHHSTDYEHAIYYKLLSWFKALKDRYAWKPSDGQIEALDWALSLAKNCGDECAFDIRTLQDQLKKLKE